MFSKENSLIAEKPKGFGLHMTIHHAEGSLTQRTLGDRPSTSQINARVLSERLYLKYCVRG